MLTPIGLDPGFGNFKAALIQEEPQAAVVPSVVGVGETDLGLLSLGALARRRRHTPDRVSFAGVTYLVGEHVARFARPARRERMDFLRLSDGPELRALGYDALFRLLGEGEHQVALMVGLPVAVTRPRPDWVADRDQARATLRALRAWLPGEHRCAVNDTDLVLHVADVRAMAQPVGAYFAWGLDQQGQWSRPKADLQAPVGVCDVGFNTVDLFAVAGGDVVARFVGGDTVGIRWAACPAWPRCRWPRSTRSLASIQGAPWPSPWSTG